MAFSPKQEYIIQPDMISLKDFHAYSDLFVTRPPYQRKTVWSKKKKQSLMDSILRRYYVPHLVLRRVRLSATETIDEVIDGQQRINTLQEFFSGKYPLPKSLDDLGLAGKLYPDLAPTVRQYIDTIKMNVDRILQIEKKDNPDHQKVATEIFWRLQQGESLNSMEVAHARLSSRTRNFLVKYADDITFDYEKYQPVDDNPSKHKFFRIIARGNERMEHLAILARMLLIEREDGYTDLKDKAIQEMIDREQVPDGIGNDSYEEEKPAKSALRVLNLYYELFFDDPMLNEGGKIQELKREYFLLSFYLLIRHVSAHYVVDGEIKNSLRSFFDEFYARWRLHDVDDTDVVRFSDSRQQGARDLEERDIILRHNFFRFLSKENTKIKDKDSQRAFNEAQRIEIYRRDKGVCQFCLGEGKSDKETQVSWVNYQADHIVAWIKGGETSVENAQVLCRHHNQSKGGT